jgi:hypothetical protein
MSTFLTTGALKEDIIEITASATPLVLTSLSPAIIHVKGITTQLIILPKATTLENGIHYFIINDSTGPVTVNDYSYSIMGVIYKGFSLNLYLCSNALPAGSWVSSTVDPSLFNDKNLKLIGGGFWSWDYATTTLSFTADAYIIVDGLLPTANTIALTSVVLTSNEVAYVIFNRDIGGPPLTIQTCLPSAIPTTNNSVFIIAYTDGNDVIVGHSFRLTDGQSSELDQGISTQTRALLGSGITPSSSSPDWALHGAPLRTIASTSLPIIDSIASIDREFDNYFGQLRLNQGGSANIISITGADRTVLTGQVLSQSLGARVLEFLGANINFTTGVILDALSNPLGLNFTPYSVPIGQYFWYCIQIAYKGTNADGSSYAQIRVGQAASSNANDLLAPYPQFPSLFQTNPLGLVQVYNNAGNIEVFKIRQLGVGSGGGGSGSGGGLTSVRAMDLTTSVLPTGTTLTVDGVSIAEEDTILYGNAALNRVYKVTGIGTSISFEALSVFTNGNTVPQVRDPILVREGTSTNCTIWFANPALTPPWERVAGIADNVWTGSTPYTTPSFDGTLSTADTNLKLALDTIDKYFRGLQLRSSSVYPHRVKILSSSTSKTDLTTLSFTIADRLMSFSGAEIDFQAGNIYASDGVTVIGTFPPYVISTGSFFWYTIGFNSTATGIDNTINPQIVIEYATNTGITALLAPKPSITARYTLGAVVVQGLGGINIAPVTQASIVYLGQFTGYTALEATVAQNTLDIAALQAFISSMPMEEVFMAGVGGQSVFNLTLFSLNASNTILDADFYIDGRWQTQSITGDFLDGGAVKKNSATQVQTAEVVPEGKLFAVLKRTMGGGYPLVDLTAITVNLGFVTPKSVGTLARPAASFILKDTITADIWQLQVVNGVFQVVKIN